MGATNLAAAVKLTAPRALALRRHLKIDEDPTCRHTFRFGKAKHERFSDNARNKMKAALDGGIDMDEVWNTCRPGLPPNGA